MKKLSKRAYQLAFIELTKSMINDDITLEDYNTYLKIMCSNYRKDYNNGNA